MRLYKRGGYWWCSFPWEGQTIRRSTRCTTRGAAMLVAQRWERERADPDHAAAQAATVGGAVDGFLAELARSDRPQVTKRFYRQKCGVLVRIFGADAPLNDAVTAAGVDRYIAQREGEPVAYGPGGAPSRFVTANTIHKELVALRQVLKRARRRGEFRKDPAEVLPVGFSPKYEPRRTSLTMEQAAQLCEKLPGPRAATVAFILATTARRSEAFAARVEDVELELGCVHLRGTKTEGADRTVSVAPFARALLGFAVERGAGKGGLLLQPWPNARRGLSRACSALGIPRVTFNDLRRTLSTWLVEGGVSNTVVARLLGHVDTRMLERVYGRPREEAIGELLVRQSAALQAVRVPYVSTSDSDVPGQTESAETTEKTGDGGGPTGTRTRDLRIKRPTADFTAEPKLAVASADSALGVPLLHTLQRVGGAVAGNSPAKRPYSPPRLFRLRRVEVELYT